ncbi:protein root UVB sensitive 5-like [Lolium rigidum]|uniref:protein root UVB sensitive 5-like n=1 Tax=Lolium rigidum TaxID=89674 RepID=UPI001F5C91BB|nr:protein root UVB sensitive 5-like [Lolium rigidum]
MLSVGGRLHGGAPPWRRPRHRSCLASPPASSNSSGGPSDSEKARPVLVERYRDGAAKRYLLDGDSKLQVHWEKHDSSMNSAEDENVKSSIPQAIRDFVLPAGFPESVSDDYLQYMLLQFPTNVTGWICYTLVTSSLLKAVGVGSFTGTSAAASAAAIRWVSKDGIGAFGRILIGGRFGTLFDDDPKKWRMYADFIGSAGSIFDLTTPLYPGYFLPLASLGNLAKAVGRGFRDPSNRVIQNHFSKSGNLGEIAAKEEVWEVGAQLLGLSIGVLILDTPGIQSSYSTLTLTWLGVRLLHLWFRYQSLIVLKFRTVNLKRARILVRSHVAHHTVPGYVACNEGENILTWERFLRPQISFGVSMERMLGGEDSTNMVNRLVKLYKNEKYILYVEQLGSNEPVFLVTFKEAATSMSVLRSLWQAHWLHEHELKPKDDVFDRLEESLTALGGEFDDFIGQMEEAGWDQSQIFLKVPKEPVLVLEHQHLDQEA